MNSWQYSAALLGFALCSSAALASGPLQPIPSSGAVPPLVKPDPMLDREYNSRAQQRQYKQQINGILHKHLGSMKVESIRNEGIAKLKEFVDPAAFRVMFELVSDEKDDVRLAVLDHFAAQGEPGAGALAWAAIHTEDAAIRHEATNRIPRPVPRSVLREVDNALRDPKHIVANNAGVLAGALNIVEAIPLLIFSQATEDRNPGQNEGDLAWIAIQTSTVYVANLEPVVGDGAGGFAPVLGVLREGVLMRVIDAVVVNYRTDIHTSLVNMSSSEFGSSTEHLGYNMPKWYAWYNTEFVPAYNAKHAAEFDPGPDSTPPAGTANAAPAPGSAPGSNPSAAPGNAPAAH